MCGNPSCVRISRHNVHGNIATRTLTENYRRWYRRHYHLRGDVETESEPETDDEQPETDDEQPEVVGTSRLQQATEMLKLKLITQVEFDNIKDKIINGLSMPSAPPKKK